MIELAASREVQVVLPFMLGPDPRHLKHIEGDPVQVMVDWFDLQLERAQSGGGLETGSYWILELDSPHLIGTGKRDSNTKRPSTPV